MTRRAAAAPVAWVAGVAFLALFAALALQLRHGRDPVLGAGPAARRRGRPAPGAAQAPRGAARDRAGDPGRERARTKRRR